MSSNIKKTCYLVFSPVNRNRLVFHYTKCFTMYGSSFKFFNSFKYLNHIICNNRSDNDDIKGELEIYIYIPMLYLIVTRCAL